MSVPSEAPRERPASTVDPRGTPPPDRGRAAPPLDPPADQRAPEPRQRWRLVVARAADAPQLAQRETLEAWEAAIEAAGLPVARTDGARSRARIAFGAPL